MADIQQPAGSVSTDVESKATTNPDEQQQQQQQRQALNIKREQYRQRLELELSFKIDKVVFLLKREANNGKFSDISVSELLQTSISRTLPGSQDKLPPLEGEPRPATPAASYSALIMALIDPSNPKTSDPEANAESRHRTLIEQLGFQLCYLREKIAKQMISLCDQNSPEILEAQKNSHFLNANIPDEEVIRNRPDRTRRPPPRADLEPPYETIALRAVNQDPGAQLSKETLEFIKIKPKDYYAQNEWLISHRDIDVINQSNELLVKAAEVLANTNDVKLARTFIHKEAIYRRCRRPESEPLHIQKLALANNEMHSIFGELVTKQLERLQRAVARVIEAEGRAEDVEKEIYQIYVPEGTPVVISAPPPIIPGQRRTGVQSLYNQFSPELRRAIEAKSLEQINEVLRDTPPTLAEQYVELVQRAGCVLIGEDQYDEVVVEEGRLRGAETLRDRELEKIVDKMRAMY